jgi:hypothetical protein
MLFQHDQDGAQIAGKKIALLKHIREGGLVRVAFGDDERTTVVLPIAVFTRKDEAYAQCSWITADFHEPDTDLMRFQNRVSSYQIIVSTTGRSVRRIIEAEPTAGSNLILNDVESRIAVRWYAE